MKLKKLLNRWLALTAMALTPLLSPAQRPIEMAEQFRSSGKIYVVVAIVTIIFLGLLLFLIYLDRRIKKLEKQNQSRN